MNATRASKVGAASVVPLLFVMALGASCAKSTTDTSAPTVPVTAVSSGGTKAPSSTAANPPGTKAGTSTTTQPRSSGTSKSSSPTGTRPPTPPDADVTAAAKQALLTPSDLGSDWTGDPTPRHLTPETLLDGCSALDAKYPDLRSSGYDGAAAYSGDRLRNSSGDRWNEVVLVFPDVDAAKTVMTAAADPEFGSCSATLKPASIASDQADEIIALAFTGPSADSDQLLVVARRGRAILAMDVTFPASREADRQAAIDQALTKANDAAG